MQRSVLPLGWSGDVRMSTYHITATAVYYSTYYIPATMLRIFKELYYSLLLGRYHYYHHFTEGD